MEGEMEQSGCRTWYLLTNEFTVPVRVDNMNGIWDGTIQVSYQLCHGRTWSRYYTNLDTIYLRRGKGFCELEVLSEFDKTNGR